MKFVFLHIVFFMVVSSPLTMAMGQNENTDPKITITDVNIFPNPVQDVFQLTHPEKVKYISIYNIPGKEIKRFEVRGNNTFSINDLSKGIYIIRLFDHENEPLKVIRLNKA